MTVAAKWRRMSARVDEVSAAVNSGSIDECPDAVAGALDALYDLWEAWRSARTGVGVTVKVVDDDRAVSGEPDGETAAALVFGRGGKTHAMVEFGDLTDTFSDTFRDLYGVWRWQPYTDPNPRYRTRCAWYAQHVAGQEVLPPFMRALAWLKTQSEVSP